MTKISLQFDRDRQLQAFMFLFYIYGILYQCILKEQHDCRSLCFYSPGSKCELKAKLGFKNTEDMTTTNTDALILLVRLQIYRRAPQMCIKKERQSLYKRRSGMRVVKCIMKVSARRVTCVGLRNRCRKNISARLSLFCM